MVEPSSSSNCCLICYGNLFLTQSRGGIIALGFALVMLIVLRFKWGWLIVPVSIIALGGTISQLGQRKFLEFLSSGVSLEGLESRFEVWSRALYMIHDFPLSGVGIRYIWFSFR